VQLLEYISTETSMYYDINQQMNFSTTYYKVHDLLGRQRGPGVKRLPPMPYSYNIITGKKKFHSNKL